MKILLLTPQLPYPPQQGTSLRNYHIVRGLAAQHDVWLLSFLADNQTADPQAIAPLLALCRHVKTVPAPARSPWRRLRQLAATRLPDMAHRLHSPIFDIGLRRLLSAERFDVVQVEGIELARSMATVRRASPNSRLLFDNHNVETALQQRAFETDRAQPHRWPAAAYSWVQARRLRKFEGWACATADWVTVVSEVDAVRLRDLFPRLATPLSVIPNCIDVAAYQAAAQSVTLPLRHDIVFSGKMDYRPNVDAVLWFADAVWPGIVRQRPQTTWAIVGQKPHPRLERLRALPGVTLTGWVDEVAPYLAGAQVYVMPFRVGSGTRFKLIEAMATGLGVVSTALGAEGFPVQHGRELLLADSAAEMETAVLRLLADPNERARLGQAARQFALQYDWRQIMPRFDAIYRRLRAA